MDEATLQKLLNEVNLDWYLYQLIECQLNKPSQENHVSAQYNKSWREYLKDIQERKIGRISTARNMLQKLFPLVEWKAQCMILSFFLKDSTKTDRLWALSSLHTYWPLFAGRGKRFCNQWLAFVLDLWDKYQEKEAALFIVKYADYNIVLRIETSLAKVIGYQKVALRLGMNPNYEVNKSLLSDLDWLYVMAKLKRAIDKTTCEVIFNEVLMKTLLDKETPFFREDEVFSFALDNHVGLALWCLGELGHPELIVDFYFCDKKLQEHLAGQHRCLSKEKYWSEMCEKAPLFFPLLREYQHNLLEKWMEQYPSLRELIEILQLKIS